MKRLCCFVCATQSSSLQAVVTVRCGAVPLDVGRVRCYGRCAPQPFIASAPALSFSNCVFFVCFTVNLLEEVWFWRLLHGALPRVSVAVLPRDAEAFGGVFTLLFAPCSQSCLVMAAAVGLCGCVLVARIASSFAVAPSLCWWVTSDDVSGMTPQFEEEGTDRC
ncbi:hypothetical protein TcCL_NonESM04176 [Trypanosoma cruzi]|nr:hypothetical protein TcCL_NonESM04176 [Trypanosoma cruzi]